MLARTPKSPPTTADDFARVLRLPDRPPTIDRADAAHRDATASLQAAQQRHIEAVRLYRAQQPGQPISLTQADVDDLARPLQTLTQAEAAARRACTDARAQHQSVVNVTMAGPLSDYAEAVRSALNDLEQLLMAGAQLHAASITSKVELPSRLPGKCPGIAGLISTQRKLFNSAG